MENTSYSDKYTQLLSLFGGAGYHEITTNCEIAVLLMQSKNSTLHTKDAGQGVTLKVQGRVETNARLRVMPRFNTLKERDRKL